jgi:hypothetical protein
MLSPHLPPQKKELVFFVGLEFELRVHTCKVGALLLESYLQSIWSDYFLEMESLKLFAWTSFEP